VFGQLGLRQQLAWMQHEIAQQAELAGGEFDVLAVLVATLTGLVQGQAARLQQQVIGHAMGAAQQPLDTQEQFFRVEGFGQVVVGTGLQALDAFGPGVTRSQDQYRCGQTALTPGAQHFESRFAGQTEVENDEVVGFAAALVIGVAAIGQPVGGIAVTAEARNQFVGQRDVVFHQQQAHH